jgi:hypothetical protein
MATDGTREDLVRSGPDYGRIKTHDALKGLVQALAWMALRRDTPHHQANRNTHQKAPWYVFSVHQSRSWLDNMLQASKSG